MSIKRQVTTGTKDIPERDINSIMVGLFNYSNRQGNLVDKQGTPITGATNQETPVHKISGNDDIPCKNQRSICIPYKAHGFLEQAMSCLGFLEETITLFGWTKIYVALFECLGFLEVNHKETTITGATYQETTIHKI